MSMDDVTFDYSIDHVAAGSERFPSRRSPREGVHRAGHAKADLSYLDSRSSDFGRHAWDEGGH